MPTALCEPSEHEKLLARLIGMRVAEKIAEIGYQEAAPRLGMNPLGVKNFCWRSFKWTLPEALRAADALGLKIASDLVKTARAGKE